jgi:DNA-binding IclR family transcriptional regulator
VLEQARPLYLLGIDGPISVDFASRIGSYFPFHATGPGKLLAAFAEESVRANMLEAPLPQLTTRTTVNHGQLRRELRKIQQRGYASSAGERALGIGGIAVPVFDGSSDTVCVAALGIAYIDTLVRVEEVESYAAILHNAARTLSRRLGHATYPFEVKESNELTQLVASIKA